MRKSGEEKVSVQGRVANLVWFLNFLQNNLNSALTQIQCEICICSPGCVFCKQANIIFAGLGESGRWCGENEVMGNFLEKDVCQGKRSFLFKKIETFFPK